MINFIVMASFWSKLSAVLTLVCLLWCLVVGLFVLVKFIINKILDIKERKKDEEKERKENDVK